MMEDGTFSITSNGPELINAAKSAVSRVPNRDGVLHLRVHGSGGDFDVVIPIDSEQASFIRSLDENGHAIER